MATRHPIPSNPRFIDLTGKVFGRWTVLYYAGRSTNSLWFCKCECGAETVVAGPHLMRGKSIGCRRCSGVAVVTHGMSKSPEFGSWRALIERCTNPGNRAYARYGGRGIRVCDRWKQSFEAFYKDMGPRPSPQHSIDRIDSNGDYEPTNCRWATQSQQMRNTRRSRHLTFDGLSMSIPDWADKLGMSVKTLRSRLDAGWSIERALTSPVNS